MSGFGPLSQCSGSVTFWYGYGSVQQTYGSGRGSERTKQNLTTTMDPVRILIQNTAPEHCLEGFYASGRRFIFP